MGPTTEQIEEWRESPVTRALFKHVHEEIAMISGAMGEAFTPFDPQRTQEIMAGLNGSRDTWLFVSDLLEGDWSLFEKDEESDE